MENIFIKATSIILSILMSLFNTLSSAFPHVFPVEPIENTYEICEAEEFNITNGKENADIISDYVSWYLLADKESETAEKYDWKYFFTGSLAVITLVLPNPGYEVEITSVEENGNTVEIDYKTISGDGEYAAVLVTKVIVVQVNKNISLIDLNKISEPENPVTPEIPEEPREYKYRTCVDSYFNQNYHSTKKISDLDTMKSYVKENTSIYSFYNNEDFFEENSLIVLYIYLPTKNCSLDIYSIEKDGSSLYVYYKLTEKTTYPISSYIALVIEADKDITSVRGRSVGLQKGYTVLDSETPVNDGELKMITSVEEYEQSEIVLFPSYLNERYFSEYNLAVISAVVPNYDYELKIVSKSIYNNVMTVNYGFYETNHSNSHSLLRHCYLVVEVPKDVVEVVPVKTTYSNSGYFYSSINFDLVGSGNYKIISDYNSWLDTIKTDPSDFPKYDEEYFKSNSVVLKLESVPAYDFDYKFLILCEKDNNLEAEYVLEYKPLTDKTYEDNYVLLVEITKSVETASFSRKNMTNNYVVFEWGFFKNGLYSDYETFAAAVDVTDEKFSKYDEEYFENNSIMFVIIDTYNIGDEALPLYVYEDGNTLHFGHTYRWLGMLPSLSINCTMVEVSKNITEVETTSYM